MNYLNFTDTLSDWLRSRQVFLFIELSRIQFVDYKRNPQVDDLRCDLLYDHCQTIACRKALVPFKHSNQQSWVAMLALLLPVPTAWKVHRFIRASFMLQATQHSFHQGSVYRFQKPVVYPVKRTKRVPRISWAEIEYEKQTGELQQNRHRARTCQDFPHFANIEFSLQRTTCASAGPSTRLHNNKHHQQRSLKSASTNPPTITHRPIPPTNAFGNGHLHHPIGEWRSVTYVCVYVYLFVCVSTVSFQSGFIVLSSTTQPPHGWIFLR